MDKEYDVQKALGLLKLYSCIIYYTRAANYMGTQEPNSYSDVFFESYGPGEHLNTLARAWLQEQEPSARFGYVDIICEIPQKGLGKYNGSNSTP